MLTPSNVVFSWRQFWVSFVYENLPPVFISPIAAFILEGSFIRAWNVCQHRNLLALSTRYNPRQFILYSWLIIYPGSWIITLGMIFMLFSDSLQNYGIDPLQVICTYAFLACRRIIISVKYGYFTAAEFSALSMSAPEWTFQKNTKKLIGLGWLEPKKFPGLIEAELDYALERTGRHSQTSESGSVVDERIDLRAYLLKVIDQAYGIKPPRLNNPIVAGLIISILVAVILTKVWTATPIFGETITTIIINLGVYLGIVSGMGIMGFGLICALDLARRRNALSILDRGLFGEFLEKEPIRQSFIFETTSPVALQAWVIARQVISAFGERYHLRVRSYTSILLCFSFLCVAFLNLLAWTQINHHLSTVVVLSMTTFIIATIGSFSMFRAILLQRQSYTTRSHIQDLLLELEIEETLNNIEIGPDVPLSRQPTKNILRQIETNLTFLETTYKPTTVLGYKADNELIGSVLGLLITGLLLAIQGVVTTGVSYSENGWAIY